MENKDQPEFLQKDYQKMAEDVEALYHKEVPVREGFRQELTDKMTAQIEEQSGVSRQDVLNDSQTTDSNWSHRVQDYLKGRSRWGFLGAVAILLIVSIVSYSWLASGKNPVALIDEVVEKAFDDSAAYADIRFDFVKEQDSTQGLLPEGSWKVVSDQPLDKSSVEKNLVIQPEIKGSIEWNEEGTEFSFVPTNSLPRGQKITMTIEESAKTKDGQKLGRQVSWSVETVPDFSITGVTPAPNQRHVPTDTTIEVEFNYVDLDAQKLASFFSIRPTVAGRFEAHGNKVVFLPETPLESDQIYTVSVIGDYTNQSGDVLVNEKEWDFRTSDLDSSGWVDFRIGSGNYASFPTQIADKTIKVESYDYKGQVELALYQTDIDLILQSQVWQPDRLKKWVAPDIGNMALVERWSATVGNNGQYDFQSQDIPLPDIGPGFYYLEAITATQKIFLYIGVDQRALHYTLADDRLLTWVVDLDGQPQEGVEVRAYKLEGGLEVLGSTKTSPDGIVDFSEKRTPDIDFEQIDALVVEGDALSLVSNTINFNRPYFMSEPMSQDYKAVVVTDRPLYKPGDKVNLKVTVRNNDDRQFSIPKEGTKVRLLLADEAGNPRQDYLKQTKEISSPFGSLASQFVLAESLPEGEYKLYAYIQDDEYAAGLATFKVAHYRKPEYELSLNIPRQEIIQKESLQAEAHLKYYSGQPLIGKNMEYKVYSSNYYPTHPSYDDFGQLALAGSGFWNGREPIDSGSVVTDDQGKATIDLPTTIDASQGQHQVYTVEFSYYDDLQVPNIVQEPYAIYQGQQILFAYPKNYDAQTGSEVEIQVEGFKSLSKEPLSDDYPVKVTIERVWYERQEAGTYYDDVAKKTRQQYRYEEKRQTVVDKRDWSLPAGGQGEYSFTPTEPGSYQVSLAGSNVQGQLVELASTQVWVTTPGQAIDWWNFERLDFDISLDQELYEIGDSAKITVTGTDYPGQVLVTWWRNDIYQYRVVDLSTGLAVVEVEVDENFLPSMYVDVVALGDFGFTDLVREMPVSLDSKKLQVEVNHDQDKQYLPGSEVEFKIDVKDLDGRGQESEVLLYLVDEALLALEADRSSDWLTEVFYDKNYSLPESGQSIRNPNDYSIANKMLEGGFGAGCFAPGTMVQTPDGLRPIEDLRPGDEVYSYDEKQAKVVINVLDELLIHHQYEQDPLLEVSFTDGTVIEVTSNHLFWYPAKRQWRAIGQMEKGQQVWQVNAVVGQTQGHLLTIKNMQTLGRGQTVFNLSMKGEPRNYLVGSGILVHNDKEATAPRLDFRDSAAFEAMVKTGGDGQATVKVKLPHNLTRWSVVAKAITKDTKVGQASHNLVVSKQIVARVSPPQQVVKGDRISLPVIVSNNTDAARPIVLEMSGSGFEGQSQEEFSLQPKEDQTIFFPITILDADSWDIVVKATTDDENLMDEIRLSVPIISSDNVIVQQDFYFVSPEKRVMEIENSVGNQELVVQVLPSITSFLQKQLAPVWGYQVHSTPEVASRLQLLVTLYEHYDDLPLADFQSKADIELAIDEAVKQLIALKGGSNEAIYEADNPDKWDGAYGYFDYDARDVSITAQALIAIERAKALGILTYEPDMQDTIAYLQDPYDRGRLLGLEGREGLTLDQKALVLYALAQAGAGDLSLTQALADKADDLMPGSVAYLAETLRVLGDSERGRTLLINLWQRAQSMDEISWFAQEAVGASSVQSPTRQTALVLDAMMRIDERYPKSPQLMRWLMLEAPEPSFTATSLFDQAILTRAGLLYASTYEDLGQKYDFELLINDQSVGSGRVEKSSLTEGQPWSLALDEEAAQKPLKVEIKTDSQAMIYLLMETRSKDHVVPENNGFSLSRQWLDRSGNPRQSYRLGELGIVELTYEGQFDVEQLRIEDYLPAGLEVVNPDLDNLPWWEGRQATINLWRDLQGQKIWANRTYRVDGVDFDITTYSDENKTGRVRYLVRASFVGRFQARSALINTIMYPELRGYSQGAELVIEP